jgi:S1-C subfamily serine protease
VVILGVAQGGAAEQAGISGVRQESAGTRLGDIIVKVDTTEVHRSSDLFKALDVHKVGDQLEVTVDNQGHRRKVMVTLQAVQ